MTLDSMTIHDHYDLQWKIMRKLMFDGYFHMICLLKLTIKDNLTCGSMYELQDGYTLFLDLNKIQDASTTLKKTTSWTLLYPSLNSILIYVFIHIMRLLHFYDLGCKFRICKPSMVDGLWRRAIYKYILVICDKLENWNPARWIFYFS